MHSCVDEATPIKMSDSFKIYVIDAAFSLGHPEMDFHFCFWNYQVALLTSHMVRLVVSLCVSI
jgi:hypothetical protein